MVAVVVVEIVVVFEIVTCKNNSLKVGNTYDDSWFSEADSLCLMMDDG